MLFYALKGEEDDLTLSCSNEDTNCDEGTNQKTSSKSQEGSQ